MICKGAWCVWPKLWSLFVFDICVGEKMCRNVCNDVKNVKKKCVWTYLPTPLSFSKNIKKCSQNIHRTLLFEKHLLERHQNDVLVPAKWC